MGVKETRTATKVDLMKHAWDQPCLHVCQIYVQTDKIPANYHTRIDGTQTVC